MATELFSKTLLKNRRFTKAFFGQYTHLIAENVEEENPAVHRFIEQMLKAGKLTGSLIVYDADAGYRLFLGAEPEHAYNLRKRCDQVISREKSFVMSPGMAALVDEFQRSIGSVFPTAAGHYMLAW